ncbi:recombinase family protein [Gottfriedia acidiceleris]|uniref:recombinase family protein n=1 Tax=Gottfriedia acidiceleris TaxID=371036 RepID=UPI00101C2F4C|nr:recombinase family protein [Gottfriedia acidiceleris]
MKKTVIYVRRSLNEDKQKSSIDYQIKACLDYARNQGWIVHQVFNEQTKSARSTEIEERKMLYQLITEIKSGIIERVIVFKRDRISRRTEQYIEFVEILRQHKVKMFFAGDNEPQMFEGIVGEFIELLLGAISEYEGNNIIQRLIVSRIAKIRAGGWGGGKPPKPYFMGLESSIDVKKKESETADSSTNQKQSAKEDCKEKKVIMISQADKEKIKLIYEEFLNEEFKSMSEANKYFKKYNKIIGSDFSKFIARELHKGIVSGTYDGEVIRAEKVNLRLRAVTDELWKDANEKLKKLKGTALKSVTEVIHPKLTNLLICSKCGKKLIVKDSYYVCNTDKGYVKVQIKHTDQITLEKLTDRFYNHIAKNQEKIIQYAVNTLLKPSAVSIEQLERNLKEVKEKIEKKTVQLLQEPTRSRVEKTTGLENLVNEYKSIYHQLKSEKEKYVKAFDNIKISLIDNLPLPKINALNDFQQKRLLEFFISKIVVNEKLQAEIFYKKNMK